MEFPEIQTHKPIRKDTRVSLHDCVNNFVCMWIGYTLPNHLGAVLDNEKRWPNLNSQFTYSLHWYSDGEAQVAHVRSVGMPLGVAIQTELAMLAELG